MLPVEPAERPAGSTRSPRAREMVRAAFRILDEEGPDALTMRRLADDLGMRAPSLYKHVRDKATLETALIEDVLFDIGDVLHAALTSAGREGAVASVLLAYRARSLEHPNRYRLATSGALRRDLLPECLEEWAGQPFFLAAGDPYRSQALWSLAHGMVILEIDGRYPEGSDLDRTWAAAAAAFSRRGSYPPARGRRSQE
jgi:AcrR family transcriptional regulator